MPIESPSMIARRSPIVGISRRVTNTCAIAMVNPEYASDAPTAWSLHPNLSFVKNAQVDGYD